MLALAVALIAASLSALLTGRFYRPSSTLHKVLVILVLFFTYMLLATHLVAGSELIGLIESANSTAVAVLACVILVLVYLCGRAIVGNRALLTGVFDLRLNSEVAVSYRPARHVALVLGICGVAWMVFIVDSIAAYNFGYDGLAYHLPVALHWLREESFAIPELRQWRHSLPANGEIGMWMLLGAGFDRVAFAFNLLAAVGAATAIFLLARRASYRADTAALSAAFFLALPVTQFQGTSTYVDLFGTSFILAGLALFINRLPASGQTLDLRHYAQTIALAGLAWGIAVGTKHIFYLYGALCCAGATIVIWYEFKDQRSRALALTALLVACMLVPCAFWLLRAVLTTGNPFYPVAIGFLHGPDTEGYSLNAITGGPELDAAFVRSKMEWLIYPWIEYRQWGHPYGTGSGVGVAWATFVPASLVFTVILGFRRFQDQRTKYCLFMLLIVISMAVLWWFGLRRLPRFGIILVALACVLTGPLIDYIDLRRPRTIRALFVLFFATSAVLSASIPGHSFLGLVRSNIWTREEVFEIPTLPNEFPVGTTIWLAHEDEAFAFAMTGRNLTNRVVVSKWWTDEVANRFARDNKVEYVADRSPYSLDRVATLGAKVIFEEKVGPTHSWKIWAMPAQPVETGMGEPRATN